MSRPRNKKHNQLQDQIVRSISNVFTGKTIVAIKYVLFR